MHRNAAHAVVIAKRANEIGRVGLERSEPAVADQAGFSRHFDQRVFEAIRQGAKALRLALSGHDRLRLVELVRALGARGFSAEGRESQHADDGGSNRLHGFLF